jgi:hypothetical protein
MTLPSACSRRGRVEVTEQDDARLGAFCQPRVHGLESEDLDAVRALADRRVDDEDEDVRSVEAHARRERPLRPRPGRRRDGIQRSARGQQHAERPARRIGPGQRRFEVVQRAADVGQARGQTLAPAWRGAARDFLQRDEVGLQRVDSVRLLLEAPDAAREVPGEQPGQ